MKCHRKNVTPMGLNAIGSVIEITVEFVFFPFFDDHPFVNRNVASFTGFVVALFYSFAVRSPFSCSTVVIAADIAAPKSSV